MSALRAFKHEPDRLLKPHAPRDDEYRELSIDMPCGKGAERGAVCGK